MEGDYASRVRRSDDVAMPDDDDDLDADETTPPLECPYRGPGPSPFHNVGFKQILMETSNNLGYPTRCPQPLNSVRLLIMVSYNTLVSASTMFFFKPTLCKGKSRQPVHQVMPFARSASPALDASLVKRQIMLRRGVEYFMGFITRRAQARTRQDYDYRVSIDRTGDTLSMRLRLGMYTAVGEAAADSSWVLLE